MASSNLILVAGDEAIFVAAFGLATAIPKPGKLRGSGPATRDGKKLCVAGDEASVSVVGCPYVTPLYNVSGMGTLEIAELAPDQTAKTTRSGGAPVLLVGTAFTAKLKVQTAAKMVDKATGALLDDPVTEYPGTGTFVTKNQTLRGT